MSDYEYSVSTATQAAQNAKECPFVEDIPTALMVALRRNEDRSYPSELAKKVDTTYAHTVKQIQSLEEDGYLKSKKKGRKKICELTEKGRREADNLAAVIEPAGDEPSLA